MRLTHRALRGAIKIWGSARPRYTVVLGGRNVVISPLHEDVRGILNWSPGWLTTCVEKSLKAKPGVFFDVGANIGQTLLDYLHSGERTGYYGFEPSARCVDQINQIIKDNVLTDCCIIPAALSNTSGVTSMHIALSIVDASATMLPEVQPHDRNWSYFAAGIRYDDISGDLGITNTVALVKIDVEGAEGLVIDGMKNLVNSDRPWIICEVLTRAATASPMLHAERCRGLMALLSGLGYVVFRIGKSPNNGRVDGLTECDEFPEIAYSSENKHQCDYIFVHKDESAIVKNLFT